MKIKESQLRQIIREEIQKQSDEDYVLSLIKNFSHFSYTNKTIPNPGSPCKEVKVLNKNSIKKIKILKKKIHKNKNITIWTNDFGVIRFHNLDIPGKE